MVRWWIVILAVIAATRPSMGDDLPFAEPSIRSQEEGPSLADIMIATQWRHIKIDDAIRAKNWNVVDYEIGKLSDTFDRAAMLYQNIPVDLIAGAFKALKEMREAVSEKNAAKARAAYSKLNDACNACHRAAEIGFVVIQTPIQKAGPFPFSNQRFPLPQRGTTKNE
jgi:hypothetical protein